MQCSWAGAVAACNADVPPGRLCHTVPFAVGLGSVPHAWVPDQLEQPLDQGMLGEEGFTRQIQPTDWPCALPYVDLIRPRGSIGGWMAGLQPMGHIYDIFGLQFLIAQYNK